MAFGAASFTRLDRNNNGKIVETYFNVALDTSYPANGYTVKPQYVGLGLIYGAEILGVNGPSSLISADWDYANGKIIARRSITQGLTVEEAVTVATNKGTLAAIPGYILAVQVTAGSTTGAFTVIPNGITPATKQVAVNFTTGGLTFLGSDAVTAALVTYIPMGVGPFIPANQVVDEVVTISSSGVNLANQATLIQYVYDTTGSLLLVPCGGTVAAATGQVHTALRNSTNTTLTSNAAQSTDSCKVTYWKASAIGAAQGFTAEASIAATTGITTAFTFPSILIPTYGTQMVGLATATIVPEVMEGPSGTAAAGVVAWNPYKNSFTFAGGDSLDHIYLAYILLNQAALGVSSGSSPQVPTGSNLSAFTLRMRFSGPK